MHVLIVAATEKEIGSIRSQAEKSGNKNAKFEFLVSGVGIAATTYAMTRKLKGGNFNMALNVGLAGTFREEIHLGEVVTVVSDQFADVGAEDGEKFLSVFDLELMDRDRFPFWNGKLKCDSFILENKFPSIQHLKKVKAITVNTVHGHEKTIQRTRENFHPDVESMEGAAFHYVCMMEKIPSIQLRAISNRVERRNRPAWNIPLALNNLTDTTLHFLNQL